MSRLDGVPVRPDRGPGGLIGVPLHTDHVPLGKSRSGGFAIAFPLVEIAGYPNHRALTIVLTPASQSPSPPPGGEYTHFFYHLLVWKLFCKEALRSVVKSDKKNKTS